MTTEQTDFATMDDLLEAAKHGTVHTSHETMNRLQAQAHTARMMAAAKRIGAGERDWLTLRADFGGHELPELLELAWTKLPPDQLVIGLGDSWTHDDSPEGKMPRRVWLPIFRRAGYHDDHRVCEPPERVTVWRGGVRRTGMAWSASRERAEWFRDRLHHLGPAHLWTASIPGHRLLAHYHDEHRGEDEYVVDTTGLRPKLVATG